MKNLKDDVQKNIEELELARKQIVEKRKKEPEGSLCTSKNKSGKVRYYHKYRGKKNNLVDKFISDKLLAQSLAEKSYYRKMQECIEKELHVLKNFEKQYSPDEKYNIYRKLSAERKELIDPLYLPAEMQAEQWNKEQWNQFEKFREGLKFETDRGDMVRSKSEVIIANMLNQRKDQLSYRYEAELYLEKTNTIIHPDFTILNKTAGKIYYWEHIGMLGDPVYADDFVRKVNSYIVEGILPGEQLILSYETRNVPLNIKIIKELVEQITSV